MIRSRRRRQAAPGAAPCGAPASAATPASIRNAYTARWLAAQALTDLDTRRGGAAAETLASWTAEVASKGCADTAAAVKAAEAWRSRDTRLAAQRTALETLSKLLEDQIAEYKKSDAAAVVAVLKERIARLQSGQDRSEREGAVRRTELQHLLEELSAIDPEQPGYPKEGRKGGAKHS